MSNPDTNTIDTAPALAEAQQKLTARIGKQMEAHELVLSKVMDACLQHAEAAASTDPSTPQALATQAWLETWALTSNLLDDLRSRFVVQPTTPPPPTQPALL